MDKKYYYVTLKNVRFVLQHFFRINVDYFYHLMFILIKNSSLNFTDWNVINVIIIFIFLNYM